MAERIFVRVKEPAGGRLAHWLPANHHALARRARRARLQLHRGQLQFIGAAGAAPREPLPAAARARRHHRAKLPEQGRRPTNSIALHPPSSEDSP